MIKIKANIRKVRGKKVHILRKQGLLPCVLYGPKIENQMLKIDGRLFQKAYTEAGESSIITLEVDDGGANKNFSVLIKNVVLDPFSDNPIHVDFYQPILDKEVSANVALVFTGEPPAVKGLGGILSKNILEIEVSGLPKNLPSKILVNLDVLETLENVILVKNLILPENVRVLRDLNDVVASVSLPKIVEEVVIKEEEVEKAEGTEPAGETPEKTEGDSK